MTVAEFLAWEERQPLRYEFDGIRPVAMMGGTLSHARLQRNLAISISGRLRGGPCELLGSDMKIAVSGSIRYPDGFVVCTPGSPWSTVVRDPVVVFEVLSPGTARTDRVAKNREYAAIPSIRRYVMLEQDGIAATVFHRDGDAWIGTLLDADAVLRLPEIGLELPLTELYDGLDLASYAEEQQAHS